MNIKNWSAEEIGEFWDRLRSDPEWANAYFSAYHAPSLVKLADRLNILKGDVLDYGAGPGFLVEELLDKGHSVAALEFSSSGAEFLEDRFRNVINWGGATITKSLPSPLPSGGYDLIFTTETIEHLLEEWVDGYFQELDRLVRPEGHIVITTPYREALKENAVLCPFCLNEFHKWGHVRSMTEDYIENHAKKYGFEVVEIMGVDLNYLHPSFGWRPFRDLSPKKALRLMKTFFRSLFSSKSLRSLPKGNHLVAILKKLG